MELPLYQWGIEEASAYMSIWKYKRQGVFQIFLKYALPFYGDNDTI